MKAPSDGARLGERLVFVVATLALCWIAGEDVGFRDSGEIGASAYVLGVAHPTGFAFDLLVLRIFSYLPLGNIAWRQNLAIALQAGAALGLLGHLASRLARELGIHDPSARVAAALVAVSGLFGWLTFSATARSVEVYSLALLAVLVVAWGVARGGPARLGLCCLVIGFAPGLHVTAGAYALLLLIGSLLIGTRGAPARALWPRAPLVVAGALIIAYLPLSALRRPVLDWGDPRTVSRLLEHLTAARIRSAFRAEMLSAGTPGSLAVLDQLSELWPLLPLVALAIALGVRRRRLLPVLAPLALVVADLAYGMLVNPMGAVDRQVGHVAGAGVALLGGIGVAALVDVAGAWAPLRATAVLGAGAFSFMLAMRLPVRELRDGHAAVELYGSGGPLVDVAPRSLFVCFSDDSCAGGLFATYVEAVRPDVDVVPAQHLWEPSVLRRIGDGPALQAFAARRVEPHERTQAAGEVVRWLARPDAPRPVLFASTDAARLAGDGYAGATHLSESVPYVEAGESASRSTQIALGGALTELDSRLDAAGPRPQAEHAQEAWAQAYLDLGAQMLGVSPPLAVRAYARAVELDRLSAVAWANLGVAQGFNGEIDAAVRSVMQALELAPERASAWVTLAKLRMRQAGPAAVREVLGLAARAGIHDPRLDAMSKALGN